MSKKWPKASEIGENLIFELLADVKSKVEPHYDDYPLRRQGVRHYDENVKVGHFLVPVTTTATTTTAKILVVVVGEGGV